MKIYNFCICLFIILVATECKNINEENNDVEIIQKKYLFELRGIRFSIFENIGRYTKSDTILPLLDTIINQIGRKGDISNEVKLKISSNIANWKNNYFENKNIKVREKLDRFSNGKLSKIETLEFIEKFFEYHYWNNWHCNLSISKLVTLIPADTLLLEENKEYEFQIQIQYNDIPSQCIESNSLQGSRPNRIKFTTGNYSKNLREVPVIIKALNGLIKDTITYNDTIRYFTIRR